MTGKRGVEWQWDSEVYGEADLPEMPADIRESTWRARRADTLTSWALEAARSEDPAVLARAQVWATLAGAEWSAAAQADGGALQEPDWVEQITGHPWEVIARVP